MTENALRILLRLTVLAFFFLAGFYYKITKLLDHRHLSPRFQNAEERLLRNPSVSLPAATTRHPLAPPYPFPYKFLMNLQEKCQNQDPFLVLLVTSVSHDITSRMAVRETWGNKSNYGDVNVVTVFLVGLSSVATDKVQQLLEEENSIYGDIVQQDFMDTYYNLTLKTLMGIEWVAKYCPTASYVMKTDSDMFLNVEYLVYNVLVPGNPVHTNLYTGKISVNVTPIRNESQKWYVPKEIYPSDFYPPYCLGSGYVFSASLAQKVYNVAQVIEMMPMEDVFIGMCMKMLNISITKNTRSIFNGGWKKYNRCLFTKLVTVHSYGGEDLKEVWMDFWSKRKSECPK
ncbi:hypothetical protein GDO86_017897 [Hymenochirus boettgeri]|uniref:Hexosyltransferase n=1 Tax=Hymenochirus boettgeri TaxID=247094 RepID=A0A8T2IH47_9PIPI|nr:hypothetical protein GDO86_017897 [Hymenochirus boettgeri]